MEIIKAKTFDMARKKIREIKNKQIVFFSKNDDLNRKVIEKENINILLISLINRKDFQKQRNSGFNQVMAKEAKKKKIIIGINLDEIISSNKYEKAKILARIKQNIKLCNKNKINMVFIAIDKKYKRDLYDLKSLGIVLGMPTWMVKQFK